MSYPDPRYPEPAFGYPAVDQFEREPELREILRRAWGYKWLIASVLVLGVGTTWLVVQQIVPLYTATAALLIEPPKKNVIEFRDVVEGLNADPMTLQSEVMVLQSRELISKAVERLGLYDTNRFNSQRKNTSLFAHLNPMNYVPGEWKDEVRQFWHDAKVSVLGDLDGHDVAIDSGAGEALIDDPEKARRNAVINQFLGGLSVSRQEWTKVVQISFTFEDPKLAADAANALAETYVENTLEIKYSGTREAAEWLDNQLNQLRQRVEESEAKVERVRQGEVLVQGRNSQVVSEQITAVNQQLLDAQAQTARLSARLQQIEELRNTPDGSDESTNIIGSSMIQTLRLEQFRLEREEADLALELGNKHPRMINIRAEMVDIQKKLQREIDKYVEAARSELTVAKAREASLKRSLKSMTNQVGDLNEAEIQLRALEREAEANRSLYESFLTRSKETRAQEEIQQADARVISYAQVPGSPSYPPKQQYINGSIVGSLGLAFGLVFLLEKLDKGFRTTRQVERQTGLPVLGLLPAVRLNREGIADPADLIAKDKHSRFTESINILYSHLKWPRDGSKPKVVLVSSAMPKEGKTSTAIALARRAAILGDKVLLVDADFRHPEATRKLKLKSSPGLGEVIAKEAQLEEVLQRDEVSGAYFLAAGRTQDDPVAVLGSERFREVVEKLGASFDFIVFDSSPILAVAEPLILSRIVDQALLLIRWGKTPRQSGLAAVKQLQDFGARVPGIALTRVDLTQQSYYGYGEYGYYTNKMKGYYSS